jgi:outer membrane protein OmpA-like peptidoglycan-associated protein
MLRSVLFFAFLFFVLHINCEGQGLVEAIKSSHIFERRKGPDCKLKSTYKRKRKAQVKLGPAKKAPYQYVYKSNNSAPPKTPPQPVTSKPTPSNAKTQSAQVAASKKDVQEKPEEPVLIASNSPTTALKETTKEDKTPTAPPKNSALKNMPPDQRKKVVLDLPPDRSLTPIRFISDQDEFSVVNMDSFMEALELINQGKMVLIEGHTDDLGSDDYNLKLSMKRVEKIRALMLQAGANDGLISVIGYGEKRPIVPNNSTANREINRRIEFKVFDL